MTVYGLVCLVERVKEEVCILFRNNHFLALIKYQGSLFTLVTDQGYEDNSEIVWETLDNCDGDSIFMTSDFQVCKREKVMSAQDPLTPDQEYFYHQILFSSIIDSVKFLLNHYKLSRSIRKKSGYKRQDRRPQTLILASIVNRKRTRRMYAWCSDRLDTSFKG